MAFYFDPAPEQIAGWNEFVESRPPAVREVARRFSPWKLYRLGPDRCTIYSFSEGSPVTMTVNIAGEFNLLLVERSVFGVKPEQLTECDLPLPGERIGVIPEN